MAVVFLSPRPCEMVQFMVSRLVTSPSFFPFGQRGFRRSLRLCQMAALALTDRYSVPGGDGTIPALGLGTSHNGGRNVGAAVEEAARAGVRLFDTAQHYGTEETLGEALRKYVCHSAVLAPRRNSDQWPDQEWDSAERFIHLDQSLAC